MPLAVCSAEAAMRSPEIKWLRNTYRTYRVRSLFVSTASVYGWEFWGLPRWTLTLRDRKTTPTGGMLAMLTRKQYELLRFINERLKEAGVPPSFDEMKDALDLRSKSGIHRLITALEERGFIRRLPNRARAIEVIKLPELSGNGGNGRRGFTPSVIEGTLGKARAT